MTKPAIRPATLADLSHIVALDQEIFGAYGAQESPDVIRARLEVFPAGCAILEVAGDSGQPAAIAGYLTSEKWPTGREPALDEDPRLTHDPAGQVLCITTLAIAGPFQNRGLGPVLLDHALALAQREGCREIILETARAKTFYLRHSFTVVGERCQRGIRLYVMRRPVGVEDP